jgi:hypothetical protein
VRILGKKAPLFDLGRGYFGHSMHHLGRRESPGSRLGRVGSADLLFRSAALGLARPNSLIGATLVDLPMARIFGGFFHTTRRAAGSKNWGGAYVPPFFGGMYAPSRKGRIHAKLRHVCATLVFIKFRGPKAHDDRPKKEGEIPRFAVESQGSRRWDPLTRPAPAGENAGCGPASVAVATEGLSSPWVGLTPMHTRNDTEFKSKLLLSTIFLKRRNTTAKELFLNKQTTNVYENKGARWKACHRSGYVIENTST